VNIPEETKRLLEQLEEMGYHPFQVQQIVQDAIGTNELKTVTPEQNRKLIEALEEYIQFAKKCRAPKR
jgi:ABC-type transporter MlaC component